MYLNLCLRVLLLSSSGRTELRPAGQLFDTDNGYQGTISVCLRTCEKESIYRSSFVVQKMADRTDCYMCDSVWCYRVPWAHTGLHAAIGTCPIWTPDNCMPQLKHTKYGPLAAPTELPILACICNQLPLHLGPPPKCSAPKSAHHACMPACRFKVSFWLHMHFCHHDIAISSIHIDDICITECSTNNGSDTYIHTYGARVTQRYGARVTRCPPLPLLRL